MSEERPRDPKEIRLQQFGINDSTYERPNQNWVCGHLRDGSPCGEGPDAKGRCMATAECRPLKKGDRWVCTRRDAAGGACPCGEGPLPDGSCSRPIARCVPVRSLRAKRARFAFAAFALSLGVLCFFLFGPDSSAFVSPGGLTDAHAQILKARRTSDCSACHAAGQGSAGQWVKLAFFPEMGAVQNEKCLACHSAELGASAGLPHSLPVSTLQRLSAATPITGPATPVQLLASFAPAAPTSSRGELACVTCHQEHAGRHQNIAALADTSCQVCHQTQFQSFVHGHPAFRAVHENHLGIVFDHVAHQSRMQDGKLDCTRCHRFDPDGRTVQFTSFEQACAACHAQGSSDHHGDQIRNDIHVLLQLPQMTPDMASNWPADKLTPLLQFLIAGDTDPATVQALQSLAANHWHTDTWDADDAAQMRMAVAIKRVVKELTLSDDPAPLPSNRELLLSRIARAAGVPATSPAAVNLLDQILAAGDIIKAWQQHSLPRLADDLAGKAALAPATAPAANQSAASTPAWNPPSTTSDWFIDPAAASVNYHPTHADALDKSWIDLLAPASSTAAPTKIVAKMSTESFLAAVRIQLLAENDATCIKCHAIQPRNGSYFVNWHAEENTSGAIGYFKFDHRPHLTLISGADKCSVCHKLSTPSPAPAVMAALFPAGPANHGLAPHDKAACAVCHNPNGASDTCLTCHEYHLTK